MACGICSDQAGKQEIAQDKKSTDKNVNRPICIYVQIGRFFVVNRVEKW